MKCEGGDVIDTRFDTEGINVSKVTNQFHFVATALCALYYNMLASWRMWQEPATIS